MVDFYPQLAVDELLLILAALQTRQTTGIVSSTSAAGLQVVKSFGAKGASRNEVEIVRVLYSLHLRDSFTYANPYDRKITRTRARYTFS